ncbi:MAG: ABC transporter ATP-binding protein [Phycisphaerales bacterium JB039]
MIRVEHAWVIYQTGEVETVALRDATVDFQPGKVAVILGPSGSGKSTLLNLIGGIDRPTRGRVLVDEQDLGALSDDQLTRFRRHRVSFVFQFYNLAPTLTAQENVALAAELVDDPMAPAEALAMVGLAGHASRFPAQLSGGEQQRVGVACAIVKRPAMLLCDEPTGALDLETGRRVLEILADVARNLSATVLIVTHNSAIAAMADRVIHIGSGRIEKITDNPHPAPASEVTW